MPTYDVDTMILVQETDPSQIREGDVISFYSSDPMLDGAVNTHRVVRIEKDGGQYVYTTKGDGNNVEDPYDVKSEYLVGKVIWSSVILGKNFQTGFQSADFYPGDPGTVGCDFAEQFFPDNFPCPQDCEGRGRGSHPGSGRAVS